MLGRISIGTTLPRLTICRISAPRDRGANQRGFHAHTAKCTAAMASALNTMMGPVSKSADQATPPKVWRRAITIALQVPAITRMGLVARPRRAWVLAVLPRILE